MSCPIALLATTFLKDNTIALVVIDALYLSKNHKIATYYYFALQKLVSSMTTFSSLALVFHLSLLSHVTAVDSCSLNCLQNAICVEGSADFTEFITVEGTIFEFHNETSSSNMHCACPEGWTGLTCNRKYETCNDKNECYVSHQ